MLNIPLNLNIATVTHFTNKHPNIFHDSRRILATFIIFICSFTSALLISAVQQRTRLFNESAIQLTSGKLVGKINLLRREAITSLQNKRFRINPDLWRISLKIWWRETREPWLRNAVNYGTWFWRKVDSVTGRIH